MHQVAEEVMHTAFNANVETVTRTLSSSSKLDLLNANVNRSLTLENICKQSPRAWLSRAFWT